MKIYTVKFTESMFYKELREALFLRSKPWSIQLTHEEYPLLEAQFQSLLQEYQQNLPLKHLMINSLLKYILIVLTRKLNEVTLAPNLINKSSVMHALAYIQNHFREPITLEQAASRSHLSANYFSECFHRATGMSFKSYLMELRMQFAASLLLSKQDLSVTEICFASGYNSLSHFMRVFKDYFEMSPNAYRRQNQQGDSNPN